MFLLKWFPMRLVDSFLLAVSRLVLGDTAQFGLRRPKVGPLELKNFAGKSPVLDMGTLSKIKSGDVKVQTLNFVYHFTYLITLTIMSSSSGISLHFFGKCTLSFSSPSLPFNGLDSLAFTPRGTRVV